MKNFVIACGGTGGHLTPGIGLAQALEEKGCPCWLFISKKQVVTMIHGINAKRASKSFATIAREIQPKAANKKKQAASPFIPSIKFVPFMSPTKARLKNTITKASNSRR